MYSGMIVDVRVSYRRGVPNQAAAAVRYD
eukprot:SAG31_NODE_10843_length_1091_cov_8.166331_1_plen_28_part_10